MQNPRTRILHFTITGSIVASSLLLAPIAQEAANGASVKEAPGQRMTITGLTRTAVPAYSIRLEDQLLATLRYLPLNFKSTKIVLRPPTTTTTTSTTSTTIPATTTTSTSPTSSTIAATTTTTKSKPATTTRKKSTAPALNSRSALVAGSFTWRYRSLPRALRSQWSIGTDNVMLEGALMRFQSTNNLPTSGQMDTMTWHALVAAANNRQMDPSNYTDVLVSQTLPQRLWLYVNGQVRYSTLVNTGISVSSTANGTFPVYLRYVVTTMSGTNPNGTHYHDTGIPWTSYFNGGDALHGFIRSSYGWPQSLGCVEMPFAHAHVVWPFTPIGTLVTVQS